MREREEGSRWEKEDNRMQRQRYAYGQMSGLGACNHCGYCQRCPINNQFNVNLQSKARVNRS